MLLLFSYTLRFHARRDIDTGAKADTYNLPTVSDNDAAIHLNSMSQPYRPLSGARTGSLGRRQRGVRAARGPLPPGDAVAAVARAGGYLR